MTERQLKPIREFLSEDVYLPGWMLLVSEYYDRNGGTFSFNAREPPVAREQVVNYITPRGLHIYISQAGFALGEYLVKERQLEGLDVESFRELMLQGRMRIIELNQRFRRELELGKLIQGRFDITKLRLGKMPVLKLNFDFEKRAIYGDLTTVIAPFPVPQLNQYLIRGN